MASISSSGGILAGTWWPGNDTERESVLQQLDRTLSSPLFRSSKRYPALLKFIVEQTLDGRGDNLKERILGIEVFGRTPDYDTNSDHVVRTAAGEVRKRLAQYYMGPGRDDEIRIEVPAGSYVAQFRLTSENLSVQQIAALATRAPVSAVSLPVRRSVGLPLMASLAGNAVLIAALMVWATPWMGGGSTLRKFWGPVFASAGPVLICVGLQDGVGPGGATTQPAVSQPQDQVATANRSVAVATDSLAHRVAMADLLTLARVTSYAGERHAGYRILDPAATSFSDLRKGPTILIGVGNNNWTKQLASRQRFSFRINDGGHPVEVLDRQNPNRNEWLRNQQPGAESFRDYAIVSRLLDPRVEQVIVTLGGMGAHGTEVAGEFVTDPDQMKKLDAYAPSGWANKNLQVVLSTEVVKGSSGPPRIEAAYFW